MKFSLPTRFFAVRVTIDPPGSEGIHGSDAPALPATDRELALVSQRRGGQPLRERWQTDAAFHGFRGVR